MALGSLLWAWTTIPRGIGMPEAERSVFAIALCIAIALALTPDPV
jgi:hypothetical protein